MLDCPANKLGQVIGKNGSNIKQLEKETGCQIDVDKKGSQVHLHGSVVAIQAAVEELENITLSIEETVRLPEAVHTHLYGKVCRHKRNTISFIPFYVIISKTNF